MHLTAALLFVAVTGVAGGWGCSCNAENGFCEKTGKCRCKPGWQGVHCEHCIPFPGCLHGSCEKAWQCVCQQGWVGSLCDQDIRLCSSQPCSGNATCIETGEGGYLCVCPQGFTGPTCQLKRNICLIDGSPCQNGGTCTETGDALEASCLCPAGFSGNHCEITPDICHSNPCLNGGNCTDHGATFACSCPAGFVGLICNDTGFSPCAAAPCANGATCVSHPDGSFRCVCPKWFSGRLCSAQHRPKAKPKQAAAKPADHRVFSLTPQHYSLPAHAFHKLLQPPERDLLKITLKETVHHSPGVLSSHGQLVCFGMLALLTCLVILATTGIVLFGRCEAWLVNAKYSKLVRQQREHLLKEAGGASHEDTEHSVNIILPEKIRLNSFGKHYTSI